MDTFHGLKQFSESVSAGSMSAAARKLGLSPATVSRSIVSLEKQLGFNLLSKSSRGLGLTEAGEAYLPKVRKILDELEEANSYSRAVHSEPKGELRIHVRLAIGNVCIAPLIPIFLKENPDIRISLSMSNETDIDLIRNNIDVDIRTGSLKDSSLISRKLANSRRIICASPKYLEKYGFPQTPGDLTTHNCIVYQNLPNTVVWRFRDSAGQVTETEPNGTLRTDNGSLIRRALRTHMGIAQMTDWSMRNDLLSGRIVQILGNYEATVDEFEHGIFAVFLSSRSQCSKVRAFINFLVKNFKDLSTNEPPFINSSVSSN